MRQMHVTQWDTAIKTSDGQWYNNNKPKKSK